MKNHRDRKSSERGKFLILHRLPDPAALMIHHIPPINQTIPLNVSETRPQSHAVTSTTRKASPSLSSTPMASAIAWPILRPVSKASDGGFSMLASATGKRSYHNARMMSGCWMDYRGRISASQIAKDAPTIPPCLQQLAGDARLQWRIPHGRTGRTNYRRRAVRCSDPNDPRSLHQATCRIHSAAGAWGNATAD